MVFDQEVSGQAEEDCVRKQNDCYGSEQIEPHRLLIWKKASILFVYISSMNMNEGALFCWKGSHLQYKRTTFKEMIFKITLIAGTYC
jgi:hypothetical protein